MVESSLAHVRLRARAFEISRWICKMGVMALYVSAWCFFTRFGVLSISMSPHFSSVLACFATFTVCKQIYWLLIHVCLGSFTIVRCLAVVVVVAVAVIVDKNRIRIQFQSKQ